MRIYIIDEGQLAALKSVAGRLFTENRMHGDEMRDAAQRIDAVVTAVKNLDVTPKNEGRDGK